MTSNKKREAWNVDPDGGRPPLARGAHWSRCTGGCARWRRPRLGRARAQCQSARAGFHATGREARRFYRGRAAEFQRILRDDIRDLEMRRHTMLAVLPVAAWRSLGHSRLAASVAC